MAETAGKRLCKARLARGLTIDEAAHATKMRPDKILALENDDYSRFASNAYAKGFLLIYGRFLRVDVADQVRALETPNDIRLSSYQYLSNAPATPAERSMRPSRGRGRKPSLAPLLALALVLVVGAFGFYLYIMAQRIGNIGQSARKAEGETPRPSSQEAAPAKVGSPPVEPATAGSAVEVSQPPPSGAAAVAPRMAQGAPETPRNEVIQAVPITTPAPAAPGASSPVTGSAPPATTALNGLEVRRAEAVIPTRVSPAPPSTLAQPPPAVPPVAAGNPNIAGTAPPPASINAPPPAASTVPASGAIHEVVVEAVKKTWVKICRDDPNSPPIFMDYVYPNAGPLKLRGARFYIEARDPTGVQIRKNGAPMAYQAPGMMIQ